MDARLAMARAHHRQAQAVAAEAALHRSSRDVLIRQLRREDPARWSYAALAAEIGCSRELIRAICDRK